MSISPGTTFQIRLHSADQFSAVDGDAVTGSIDPDYTHLTYALLEEPGLELQASCTRAAQSTEAGKRKSNAQFGSTTCAISIIVYGPSEDFEDIGKFFQDNEVFLQDPRECNKNVKYYNPHRLSSASGLASCPWTQDLATQPLHFIEMTTVPARPELLDIMDSHEDLPEASQPGSILTSLAKYCNHIFLLSFC